MVALQCPDCSLLCRLLGAKLPSDHRNGPTSANFGEEKKGRPRGVATAPDACTHCPSRQENIRTAATPLKRSGPARRLRKTNKLVEPQAKCRAANIRRTPLLSSLVTCNRSYLGSLADMGHMTTSIICYTTPLSFGPLLPVSASSCCWRFPGVLHSGIVGCEGLWCYCYGHA